MPTIAPEIQQHADQLAKSVWDNKRQKIGESLKRHPDTRPFDEAITRDAQALFWLEKEHPGVIVNPKLFWRVIDIVQERRDGDELANRFLPEMIFRDEFAIEKIAQLLLDTGVHGGRINYLLNCYARLLKCQPLRQDRKTELAEYFHHLIAQADSESQHPFIYLRGILSRYLPEPFTPAPTGHAVPAPA